MKVVFIQLIGFGGIALYTSQLANAIAEENVDVSVLVGKYLYNENYYTNSKVDIKTINIKRNPFAYLFEAINPYVYYKILSYIHKENPDIVHLAFEDFISGIVLTLLKFKGQKIVWTEHDPVTHSGLKFVFKLHLSISKFLLRKNADKILVHGNKLKNILITKGISIKKIHSIQLGNSFIDLASNYDEFAEDANTVLFFGRIQEYKGLEYLIKAVPIVSCKIPNIKIIIAGEGNIERYISLIENIAHFEIHNRHIPDKEIASFFQRANFVVLPYKDGTQSGIVPMAYAFRKPVVVTDVGSIGEVVENDSTGFIIPPQNVDALAKAMLELLQNEKLRKSMGKNGYIKTCKETSWKQIGIEIVKIYTELL